MTVLKGKRHRPILLAGVGIAAMLFSNSTWRSEMFGRLDRLTPHRTATQSGRLRVSDTTGHLLPSLFVNMAVDPSYLDLCARNPAPAGRGGRDVWDCILRGGQ